MDDHDTAKVAEAGARKLAGNTLAGDMAEGGTVNEDEVAFFAKIADTWWDPKGPFKPLHKLNPTRLKLIREAAIAHFGLDASAPEPFAGLKILDIGCGGGLVSEPMRRLGGDVMGVDASERNVKTAQVHADQMGLDINYRMGTAEALAEAGESFDLVINMEVVEHVADVDAYLRACHAITRPGGLMITSTISRTAKAFVFAIVGAEYVLRWLPKGAHEWDKFIKPRELSEQLSRAGFSPDAPTGMVFSPLMGWSLSRSDFSVNYAITAHKAIEA